MKDENFIVIQGWMINRLNLAGKDLIAYAVIYGFSQDGESEFEGSFKYLSSLIGCSRPTGIKVINSLIEKGLIKKRVETLNGVTFNRYRATLPLVKKLYHPSKETLPGGGKETLPNKDIIDKDTTKEKDSQKELFKKGLILPWPKDSFSDSWQLWKDFKRKEKGFRFKSIESEQAAINKLSRLSDGQLEVAKKIILQSIENGWSGFFQLKEEKQQGNVNNGFTEDQQNFLANLDGF